MGGGQAARSGRDGPGTAPVQTGSVQHEGGGTGEEAGVTVQTEPQTLETTTTDGHDGDSGRDGGSSGPGKAPHLEDFVKNPQNRHRVGCSRPRARP